MTKGRFGKAIIKDANGRNVYAKTHGQHELIKAIDEYDILFVNGPAGTGKTFIATCKAVNALDSGECDRIVLTRPAVEAGEELGFLPGTLNDKISPYMQPLFDSIEKLKKKKKKTTTDDLSQRGSSKRKKVVETTNDDGISDWGDKIEIAPLAFMRGSTHEKSFVIADGAQNISVAQMKLILTRLGEGSKLILCGDISQSDLSHRLDSGFRQAQKLLSDVEGIGFITLTEKDIVRHKLVKDIILKYEKHERSLYNKNNKQALLEVTNS